MGMKGFRRGFGTLISEQRCGPAIKAAQKINDNNTTVLKAA